MRVFKDFDFFTLLPSDAILGTKNVEIVVGGYLLQKVYWNRNERFAAIFVKYVTAHTATSHWKCNRPFFMVILIIIQEGLKVQKEGVVWKFIFLLRFISLRPYFHRCHKRNCWGNEKNKALFISILRNDTDVLIVNTGIYLAPDSAAIVNGKDMTLNLLFLCSLTIQTMFISERSGEVNCLILSTPISVSS